MGYALENFKILNGKTEGRWQNLKQVYEDIAWVMYIDDNLI